MRKLGEERQTARLTDPGHPRCRHQPAGRRRCVIVRLAAEGFLTSPPALAAVPVRRRRTGDWGAVCAFDTRARCPHAFMREELGSAPQRTCRTQVNGPRRGQPISTRSLGLEGAVGVAFGCPSFASCRLASAALSVSGCGIREGIGKRLGLGAGDAALPVWQSRIATLTPLAVDRPHGPHSGGVLVTIGIIPALARARQGRAGWWL